MSSAPVPLEVLSTSTMTEQQAAKGRGNGSASNAPAAASKSNYKGFVAGVFSGIAKLSGESVRHVASLNFWINVRVVVSANSLDLLVGHPYVIRVPPLACRTLDQV